MAGTRIEKDSFGPIEVPAERLWGAQTERSRRFFRISTERMPLAVVYALAAVKNAGARVNSQLGLLDPKKADAIQRAAAEWVARIRSGRIGGRRYSMSRGEAERLRTALPKTENP